MRCFSLGFLNKTDITDQIFWFVPQILIVDCVLFRKKYVILLIYCTSIWVVWVTPVLQISLHIGKVIATKAQLWTWLPLHAAFSQNFFRDLQFVTSQFKPSQHRFYHFGTTWMAVSPTSGPLRKSHTRKSSYKLETEEDSFLRDFQFSEENTRTICCDRPIWNQQIEIEHIFVSTQHIATPLTTSASSVGWTSHSLRQLSYGRTLQPQVMHELVQFVSYWYLQVEKRCNEMRLEWCSADCFSCVRSYFTNSTEVCRTWPTLYGVGLRALLWSVLIVLRDSWAFALNSVNVGSGWHICNNRQNTNTLPKTYFSKCIPEERHVISERWNGDRWSEMSHLALLPETLVQTLDATWFHVSSLRFLNKNYTKCLNADPTSNKTGVDSLDVRHFLSGCVTS